MLANISRCFFRIPNKALALIKEDDIHREYVYTLYIHSSIYNKSQS